MPELEVISYWLMWVSGADCTPTHCPATGTCALSYPVYTEGHWPCLWIMARTHCLAVPVCAEPIGCCTCWRIPEQQRRCSEHLCVEFSECHQLSDAMAGYIAADAWGEGRKSRWAGHKLHGLKV